MMTIPNCNKSFIRNIIASNKRIDVRTNRDYRAVNIIYGKDWGTVSVQLGQTNVLAVTSCDVVKPNISRPSEGVIYITLDMCSSGEEWLQFYERPLPQEGIYCLRLLERSIRDSRCVDTESLCLVNGEKVWQIKCDITCINYDGNLCEAASIAAIASLAHFKRPDVTVSADGSIKIHTHEERHPLKLTLLHYPFCVSLLFFKDGKEEDKIVCDPNRMEEQSCDGSIVVCANSYREIVAIHCTGNSRITCDNIMKCSSIAIERVIKVTSMVKMAIESDAKMRVENQEKVGFSYAIQSSLICENQKPHSNLLDVVTVDVNDDEVSPQSIADDGPSDNIYVYGRGMATIGTGGQSKWRFIESIDSDDDMVDVNQTSEPKVIKIDSDNDDEDDDDVVILKSTDFHKNKS